MIAYKSSDVKISWENIDTKNNEDIGPKTCGYVKEGPELEIDQEEKFEENNSSLDELIREKRQVDQYEYTPTKTRCPLLLVADYRFFQEMGGSNTKTTINYLVRNFLLQFLLFLMNCTSPSSILYSSSYFGTKREIWHTPKVRIRL